MDILYVLIFIIIVWLVVSYLSDRANTNDDQNSDTISNNDENITTDSTRMLFEGSIFGGSEKNIKSDKSDNSDHPDSLVEYYNLLRERMENHDETIKDKTIVQLHYADWCMYCKKIKPIWQKLKRSAPHNPKLKHIKLVQLDQDTCVVPGIKTIPTLIKQTPDGKINKFSGEKNYRELFEWITE